MAHTYRMPAKLTNTLLGIAGGGGLLMVLRMSADDDVPAGWVVGVAIGFAVFVALLLGLLRRLSTTVDRDGVLVRRLTRSTRYPWPEIADLRFEQISAGISGTVLYDRELRRVPLPHLTQWSGGYAAAEAETLRLRQYWESQRGEHWQPHTDEVTQRATTHLRRSQRWLVIGIVGGLVFGVLMGILAGILG